MKPRQKYLHLLEDPDVGRWYENVARGLYYNCGGRPPQARVLLLLAQRISEGARRGVPQDRPQGPPRRDTDDRACGGRLYGIQHQRQRQGPAACGSEHRGIELSPLLGF
ncbi:MAG: hypothetical protein QXT73_05915 [Candidatus Methanomethylicaceae archaeon]